MSADFFDDVIRNELLELMSHEDLKAMDHELLGQLVDALPKIERAFAAAEWTEVYKLTHKLAGASEMLGVMGLGKALRQLELPALDSRPGDLKQFQMTAALAEKLLS